MEQNFLKTCCVWLLSFVYDFVLKDSVVKHVFVTEQEEPNLIF